MRNARPAPCANGKRPMRRCRPNSGLPATPYTSETTVNQTAASVTQQSLAIIDLENQQAAAGFRKIAEASGAAPAYYEFVSSTAGGYAAIAAPVVALMNTTPGGEPLVAIEVENGDTKFSGNVDVRGGRVNINDRFLVGLDGTATILSSSGSSRMEMTNAAIKAFNNGVKRVQLGDLTA